MIATAIAAAVTVALAGCSSGSKSASGSGAKSGGKVLKIAEINTLSGPNAVYGTPALHGAQLEADQVNAAGGIPSGLYKGDKIQIVGYDDQLQTTQAALAAQKVADDPDIWAAEGFVISDDALAARPILEHAGIPLVTTGASAAAITTGAKNVFIALPPNSEFGEGAALVAKARGATSAAIIQVSGALGDSLTGYGQEEFKKLGIPVTSTQQIPLNTTDVRAQLVKAQSTGANTLFAVAYNVELTAIVNGLDSIGWHPIIVDPNGTGGAASVQTALGTKASGMVGAGSQEPKNPAFIAAYAAKYGTDNTNGQIGSALGAYQATQLIVAGLTKGPKTRANLGPLLYHISIPDKGVATLRFDDHGNPIGQYLYFYLDEGGTSTIKWLYDETNLTEVSNS